MSEPGGMPPWWSLNKPVQLLPVPLAVSEPQAPEGDWLDELWSDPEFAPADPDAADETDAVGPAADDEAAAAPKAKAGKKKPGKGKGKKAKPVGVGRATVSALRGQTTRAELAGEVEAAAVALVGNSRLRWAAYNGVAALSGFALLYPVTGGMNGLEPWMGQVLVALPACGAFVVTVGSAYTAYRLARPLKGLFGPLAGIGAGVGAALWGQGTGPLIAQGLAWSAPWSVLLAPLLVAGGAGALCLALESRVAGARWPLRWLARIPLATVTVSSLLYAPGALL